MSEKQAFGRRCYAALPRRTGSLVAAVVIASAIFWALSLSLSSTHTGARLAASASSLTGGRIGQTPAHRDFADDTLNSTLGFEKIFIVSLPYRTDRRDRMVLQASLSHLEFEFIDSVNGADIKDKAIPMGPKKERITDAQLGCWRGHINAMHEIIKRNISSALILEDDADWDVRIHEQLRNFSLATRALTQPLLPSITGVEGTRGYLDPTYPHQPGSKAASKSAEFEIDGTLVGEAMPRLVAPTTGPYGDAWDLLWVGHCGMQVPQPGNKLGMPTGRVAWRGTDDTVPHSRGEPLVSGFPEHSRVVHQAKGGVCTLSYAVSRAGALRFLRDIGLHDVVRPIDLEMSRWCDGDGGQDYHRCLAPNPAYFQHHRPRGATAAESDISPHGDGFREKAASDLLRWSVALNAEKLVAGDTNYEDQFPDEA